MNTIISFVQGVAGRINWFEGALVLASWASAVLGAAIAYHQLKDTLGLKPGLRGFLSFCFPRRVLISHSAFLDYRFVLVRKLTFPFLIAPVAVGAALVTPFYERALTGVFGSGGFFSVHWWDWGLFCVVALLLTDFTDFAYHYFCHKIPIMWEFHKVHHTAEELLPITNHREHPVEEIIDNIQRVTTLSVLVALFSWIYGTSVDEFAIGGIDVYFLGRLLSFYHLRHSHIYMRFGWLERFFMSPAHHHVHHSVEPEHWDKNFAQAFVFWDRLAGTLADPPVRREFRMGIPDEERVEYRSVWQLYLMPVWRVGRRILGHAPGTAPAGTGRLEGTAAELNKA
jgi:sterol desaturase/sphingolipid hydroxylase (fatty acid hydroxylase superfamily)